MRIVLASGGILLLPALASGDSNTPAADYSGTWTTEPRVTYACGPGLVAIDFAEIVVAHTGSTITFTPPGTEPGTMSGTIDAGGAFTSERVIPGGVTQTYALEGAFIGGDSLAAVFTARYMTSNGTTCANQTDSVVGSPAP